MFYLPTRSTSTDTPTARQGRMRDLIMARQNRTAPVASTETDDTTTAPEGTVTSTETETAPEATNTETPAADAPVEIDLTEFNTAVESAAATRDTTTGVVAEAEVAKVTTAYQGLPGIKPKNAAKDAVEALMLGAVENLDIQLARAYNDIKKGLKAGGGTTSAPKAPADPKAAYVQRLTALRLAASLVEAPEGIDADAASTEADTAVGNLADEVAKYREYLALPAPAEGETPPEAPSVSAVVKQAFKLASGKSVGGTKSSGGSTGGPRADIQKHVDEFFADKEAGEAFKVSQVANFKSAEYPEGNASQGAISARLFPSSGGPSTLTGVVAIERDDKGPRRVAKA